MKHIQNNFILPMGELMRVLVTGGSGVIGAGLIPELLEGGHQVRLLSREADKSSQAWPVGVEPFRADVSNPDELQGAADACQAVVHIAGIVAEDPPEITFESVNVGGTRNLLNEASRAGTPKFIFISSLAAERGASDYHRSKHAAEDLVRTYRGPWIILRPGNVYGPGDEVISKLLSMQRTLPAIPMIGAGAHPFQPLWYSDLGKAIRVAIEGDVAQGIYKLAGDEITTANTLLDLMEKLTGRSPLRLPIPEFLAGLTIRAAQALSLPFPINESQFQMIIEENVVEPPESNALHRVFHVDAMPLENGLRILADAQPEQQPADGVGQLEHKRFLAEIKGSRFTAEELMAQVRLHCLEMLPIDFHAEPGAPQEIVQGASLTASIPLRGNIQIRVEEVTPLALTFATLRGHPLAGVVRFSASGSAETLKFEVTIYARAATVLDWVALKSGGQIAQDWTWQTFIDRVVEMSGGNVEALQEDQELMSSVEAERIEEWIQDLVAERKVDERKGAQEWKEIATEAHP